MSISFDTQPPQLSGIGFLRWIWRQLTSMRTALVLLLLLAVASIPGSIFPQRSQNPLKVNEYYGTNPALAQWLDRLSLFNVYSSPWFSAIYILLSILDTITALGKIRDWLPVHYAFSWFDALATTIDYSVMIRGGSYCFIAGTILYALAINRFAHKDVTS